MDQAELRGQTIPKVAPLAETHSSATAAPSSETETERKPMLKTATKSRALPRQKPTMVKEEMSAWEAAEWSDPLTEMKSPESLEMEMHQMELQNLHGRMTQMESVMTEVAMRLRQLTVIESPPPEQH